MNEVSFQYQALDRRGIKTRGVLRAPNRNEAYRRVRAAGLQPLQLKSVRTRSSGRKAVTLKDISHFTYQFSVLLEARIPMIDGLRSIAEQEPNPRLARIIRDVADRIAAGGTMTDAISAHAQVFGEVYVETIRAAECSGNMTLVLGSMAEMLERQYDMTKNVKGALMYPLCVVSTLVLAVTFLMMFMVPKFASMFASRGVELPVPTQILVMVSGGIRDWWFVIAGVMVAGWWGVRRAWKNPITRQRMDTAMHRLPFVREVLRGLAISRFSNVLGVSLKSGLSLLEALEMAGRASGRPMLQADTDKLREQVNHGGRLADVLMTCNYLPAFTRRMLTAGEEAAELPKMCSVVARHYDREVTHLTKNVTTVIEPILIVGLAAVVLMIALAIFLPMWNMTALMT